MSTTYTIICKAEELKTGDHISWPAKASSIVQHHVLVVAPKGGNSFRIIHVTEQEDGSSKSGSHCAVEEIVIDLGEKICKGILRRYDHDPKFCCEPTEVVNKARKKIGPFDYDLITNNCEHFARGCKTDNSQSYQADIVTKSYGSSGNVIAAIIRGKKK